MVNKLTEGILILNNENILLLIENCKKGSRESQKQVYGVFYAYSMSICLRYTKNKQEAMEVVNDGFMKIFRDIAKFTPPVYEPFPSFKAWLKKIMIFTAIDYFRTQVKHMYQDDITEMSFEPYEERENALDALSYQDLISFVQMLSPAYRTVFNLYVIDGFSHEEISKQLGIAEGTSKSNLAKARINLKEMLKRTHQEVYERYNR